MSSEFTNASANLQQRVSVVVPSYNHGRFVADTLKSIFKQTLRPSELLVIDDGSTDESPRVLTETLKQCPFPCELVVRENRGLSATLNQGLALTSGDYFAYLGSDDLWLEDVLKSRVELLELRPRAALSYGHAYIVDEQNMIVDCTQLWADYDDGDVREMLMRGVAPMSPTVLYRRGPLERCRWNESARLEDYDLYLRLSADYEFAFDPTPRAGWRRHAGNTSWDQLMMLEEQVKAQQTILTRDFHLDAGEVRKLKTRLIFTRAEDFLRIGDKTTALRLIRQNISGASSITASLRMLARLLLPFSVVQWRQNRLQRKARARYGAIEN